MASNRYRETADVLLRESGVTVRKWRTSNTGAAATRSALWEIEAPEPRGPVSFGVFAHEVAHQLLHRTGSKQRWMQEVEAEDWALEQFDRFELPGRERYEQHAAEHLAYAFAKAIRRSKRLVAEIVRTYPEWWLRAEQADAASMARPSLSKERRDLDRDR